jgi:hypothetical protein
MNTTGHALQPPAHPASRTSSDPKADALIAQRAWIALLRGDPPATTAPPLSDAQWASLIDEARRHQLSGFTYHVLSRQPNANNAPESVLDRLRQVYVKTALYNAALFRHTSLMTAHLGAHGIPVMLLKGIHLARFTYAEPAMRSMADIDIMVPRDRLADAEALFLEHGYGPPPATSLEERCSWSNHLPKLSKPGAPVFEIHWGIERPTSPFDIDLDVLWARSRTETLQGAPVQLLSLEDLLLHLVLHNSYHHRFDRSAFKGLADIHTVIVRHGEEIDWQTIADRAVEWGASGFAYATLRLTAQILGTPVPEQMLQALPREQEDEDVIEIGRRYILMPGQELPPVYVKLARSRSLRERAVLLQRHVFLPRSTMERIYGLQSRNRFLWPYYAHRIAHLLVRRGKLSLHALLRMETMKAPIDREEQRLRIEAWVKDLPGKGRPD